MKTFNKSLFTSYEAFNILQHKPCKTKIALLKSTFICFNMTI